MFSCFVINFIFNSIQVENQISTYCPNGYMVVYAVNDTDSLAAAEKILKYLQSEDILASHAVILVANKTDLVRSRVISTGGNILNTMRSESSVIF